MGSGSPVTRRLTVALVLVLFALSCSAPASARVVHWGDGAWCWFADPRAVHVVGRFDQTFVGWIDWIGNVIVGQSDPRFGVLRTRVLARIPRDDHSSPSLLVEPDNRLTVFYSPHNGRNILYRTSLRPEDNTYWGPERRVPSRLGGPVGNTYPNPVLLPADGNRLWLFWRGPDYSQDFAIRGVDGRWRAARRLIPGRPPPSAIVPGQRPYVKVDSNGSDTIGIAFTDGHPREQVTSIYYAAYRAGALWTAGGRRIATLAHAPIEPRQADIVYNARARRASAWVWDIAFGRDGRPVIVFATFPTVSDHVYWYARWTGHGWRSHLLTHAGPSISPFGLEQQYSGGIALDHANPSVVYLSRRIRGWWAIEKWTTPNGGSSWRHTSVVGDRGVSNLRPVVPRGPAGGPVRVLWMRGRYGTFTSYATSIAFTR
jgi:hypothetical protein